MGEDTRINRVEKEVGNLEEELKETEEHQSKLEFTVFKIGIDVEHIKEKIDNGLTDAVKSIDNKLNGLMTKLSDNIFPKVQDNADWIRRIKNSVVWLAVTAFGGGMITTAFYLLRTIK